ncbi:MAG: hypothetical protein JWR19_4266 [Pedosphaera sp.]|nr:hypothetical protein [Pedosphaera sp.]
MAQETSVWMTFSGLPLSGETLARIDECFQQHNFKPDDDDIWLFDENKDEWLMGFAYKDRERILTQGSGVRLAYSAVENPNVGILPHLRYTPDLLCYKLFMITPIEFKPDYTKLQRDWAKRVESLCVCLHRSLGAVETRGRSEYQEEYWFHFSQNEWKGMGELILAEEAD